MGGELGRSASALDCRTVRQRRLTSSLRLGGGAPSVRQHRLPGGGHRHHHGRGSSAPAQVRPAPPPHDAPARCRSHSRSSVPLPQLVQEGRRPVAVALHPLHLTGLQAHRVELAFSPYRGLVESTRASTQQFRRKWASSAKNIWLHRLVPQGGVLLHE